jgi:hypothetical protein
MYGQMQPAASGGGDDIYAGCDTPAGIAIIVRPMCVRGRARF